MPGIREYLAACRYRQDFLNQQRQWLIEEKERYGSDAQGLEETAVRIRQELVGYLLPEVHDDYIAALEQRLSYPGLSPIKREFDQRFDDAEKRRLELEAMEEIQFYDYQINQANEDVEDVRPAHDRIQTDIGYWENSKWFGSLHGRGYFQRDYRAGFFRRFFDWRCVSSLMAELSKRAKLDFQVPEQLKLHYRNLREEADTIIAAFDKRVAERDRIANLKSEYEGLLQAPERLLAELFRELGDATVQHLDDCPEDLRMELARGDSHLNTFMRKSTGVRKQIQYLRELSVTRIDSRIQQVDQELTKTARKINKLEIQRSRGKWKSYSQRDIDRMKTVKAEKWQKKREKTEKIRRKIAGFDKHDRGSWVSDYLWWDLMTGGSVADDVLEVREFRRLHPDWDHRAFRDPTDVIDSDSAESFDDAAEDLATSMMAGEAAGLFDPS